MYKTPEYQQRQSEIVKNHTYPYTGDCSDIVLRKWLQQLRIIVVLSMRQQEILSP